MSTTHHDLAHELPEFKETIHDMKMNNAHFRNLFDKYNQLAKDIHRVETGAENTSDHYLTDLRKQRLLLKDEMVPMMQPKSCESGCGCSGKKMSGAA